MNYPDNKTFYKRNIGFSYFIEFFSSLYFLIPIWVAFELRFISFSQLATAEIIILTSQLVLELPTGALADLLGKKLTIFLGTLITGISYIIFGLADSYSDFIFSALMTGLGASLTSGAKEAFLFDTLKQVGKEDTFDKVSSKLNVVFQSGMALAIFLGGFLSLIHFRIPPILSGIMMMFGSFFIFFLFEPKIDSEKFTLINYAKQTKRGFMELFKTKYSSLISIFYGLVGGITFSVQVVFAKLIIAELSFSDSQSGIIFSTGRILNSLVLYYLLNKTKILTRKRSLFLFAVLIPLSLLPGIIFSKQIIIPFVVLMMMLSIARWSLLGKYTNAIFTSKNRATAISALSMFASLIYVFTMAISGPLIEKFGDSKIFFTILGAISLVTITPLGVYLSKMKVDEKQPKLLNEATVAIPPEMSAI